MTIIRGISPLVGAWEYDNGRTPEEEEAFMAKYRKAKALQDRREYKEICRKVREEKRQSLQEEEDK